MKALIPILELGEAVERSAAGIPRAWRLLKNGENAFTLKGEDATLTLGEKEFRVIVDYHRKKGCKIPIDSRHFISHLATKLRRDESEILKQLPDLAVPAAVLVAGTTEYEDAGAQHRGYPCQQFFMRAGRGAGKLRPVGSGLLTERRTFRTRRVRRQPHAGLTSAASMRL